MSSTQIAILIIVLLVPMILIIAQLRNIAVMLRRILNQNDLNELENELNVVKEFPAPSIVSRLHHLARAKTPRTPDLSFLGK
jgi:hypothetical protein